MKLIGWKKFKTIAEKYIEQCDDRSIIDAEQIESIRDGFRFGGFEVLYYLLTNGYIMQDYMMFRSIFHQGSISVNDNDYIKAVGRYMSCEEVNRNFSLDNPGDVFNIEMVPSTIKSYRIYLIMLIAVTIRPYQK